MANPLDVIRKRKRVDAAFKRFGQSADGKIILEYLFKNTYGMSSTYVANDPNQTLINEGSRRMMLSILKKCYVDQSEQFVQLEEMYRESA